MRKSAPWLEFGAVDRERGAIENAGPGRSEKTDSGPRRGQAAAQGSAPQHRHRQFVRIGESHQFAGRAALQRRRRAAADRRIGAAHRALWRNSEIGEPNRAGIGQL